MFVLINIKKSPKNNVLLTRYSSFIKSNQSNQSIVNKKQIIGQNAFEMHAGA